MLTRLYFIGFIFLFFTFSCQKEINTSTPEKEADTTFVNNFSGYQLTMDTLTWEQQAINYIIDPQISEISGIVPSYANDSCFWVHEDSGSEGRLLLYNTKGKLKGHYTFHGLGPVDMEDIAIVPNFNGTTTAKIFVGDFGDNSKARTTHRIFVMDDVLIEDKDKEASNVSIIEYVYPTNEDGEPVKKDCEAFFVDPLSMSMYFFTKEYTVSYIYKLDYPYNENTTDTLEYIGMFSRTRDKITAADISGDGADIIIKTYGQVFYWKRELQESWSSMVAILVDSVLKTQPVLLPYQPEVQGEAICWGTNKRSYTTISEISNGIPASLNHYLIK